MEPMTKSEAIRMYRFLSRIEKKALQNNNYFIAALYRRDKIELKEKYNL